MGRTFKDKSGAQRSHAKARYSSRFDEELSDAAYDDMVWQIQYGKAKPVARQSHRVTVFKVKVLKDDGGYRDGRVTVVYDKKRQTIVTVLTNEMCEESLRTGVWEGV